jgi:hypothetical protein
MVGKILLITEEKLKRLSHKSLNIWYKKITVL